MGEPRWLDEREDRVWRSYLSMSIALSGRLNSELQRATGLSSADYEVLVHLSEAPCRQLRVLELGRAIGWEKSRLSHHLTRMERRRLVARRECTEDGRGAFAVLTPEGAAAIEAAAPVHLEQVRRYVVDALSPEQLDALGEITTAVLAALDEAGPGG